MMGAGATCFEVGAKYQEKEVEADIEEDEENL